MTFSGQTQCSFLLGKYLQMELLSHNRQFSQVIEPVYTITRNVLELSCTMTRDRLPGKQGLQQSSVCRMFVPECPWDQLLWKGVAGSKIGQRSGAAMQANSLGFEWGVRMASQEIVPHWAKLASPLCLPPNCPCDHNKMWPRQSLKDWRWRLSALSAAGATITSLKGAPGGASQSLRTPHTHAHT